MGSNIISRKIDVEVDQEQEETSRDSGNPSHHFISFHLNSFLAMVRKNRANLQVKLIIIKIDNCA